MSGAKRSYFEFCELQEQKERKEQREQNIRDNKEKGQPSPVNDGNLKGNQNGLYRN